MPKMFQCLSNHKGLFQFHLKRVAEIFYNFLVKMLDYYSDRVSYYFDDFESLPKLKFWLACLWPTLARPPLLLQKRLNDLQRPLPNLCSDELLQVTSSHPLNKTLVTCSSRTLARRNNDGFTPRFGFAYCTADNVFWKILDGRKSDQDCP